MAYTKPTPTELKARYPAFDAVADTTIQYWLTDAERYVDESWAEGDYAPALMSLAAHTMAMAGLGTPSSGGALPAGVTRFKSGSMDVTLSEAAASSRLSGGLDSTIYGQEFARIRRRNFAGPRVIAAGTVSTCGYGYRDRPIG